MQKEESVFKRKEGKIIISLFFIVVVFLLLLSAWDKRHEVNSEANLSNNPAQAEVVADESALPQNIESATAGLKVFQSEAQTNAP